MSARRKHHYFQEVLRPSADRMGARAKHANEILASEQGPWRTGASGLMAVYRARSPLTTQPLWPAYLIQPLLFSLS